MDKIQVIEQAEYLQPQSTGRHSLFLYGLVRSMQPECVLEIGPFHGRMTAMIALALEHNGKGDLYTIDNFTHAGSLSGASALQANLERCGAWHDRVHVIQGDSAQVEWPAHIDIAVLDGDRQLPQFKHEVERVIAHGARCFCVHDTQYDSHPYWFMEKFRQAKFPEWDCIDFLYDVGFAVAMKRVDSLFTGWKPEESNPLYLTELP